MVEGMKVKAQGLFFVIYNFSLSIFTRFHIYVDNFQIHISTSHLYSWLKVPLGHGLSETLD